MKEISGVYSITNIKNKKRYIGSAVNIERRWMQHRSELRGGYHRSRHLQRAWKKYGEDAFRFEILATCDPDDLIAQEQFWIDAFQAADGVHGYNLSPTAKNPLGIKRTDETRKRMSDSLRRRWEDEASREQMIRSNRAAQNRPDQLAKTSETSRRLWQDENYRAKTVAASKAAKRTPEGRQKQVEATRKQWEKPGRREAQSLKRRGEGTPQAKLTEDKVRDILARLAAGETQASIASRYGVSRGAIGGISLGKSWKHIPRECATGGKS